MFQGPKTIVDPSSQPSLIHSLIIFPALLTSRRHTEFWFNLEMGFTYNILYWGCKIGLVKVVTVCGPSVTKHYGSKKNIMMKCFLLSRRCTNSLLLAASSIGSLVPSLGTYNTVFPCILYRVSVKLAINLCS